MTGREKSGTEETRLQPRASTPASSPWDDMERWFDEFGNRGWLHPFSRDWPSRAGSMAPFSSRLPRVDVLDREKEIVVKAELPGVDKDDVEVTVTDHSVTIRAHSQTEDKEEKDRYFRREMSYGEYQRTLELPDTVNDEQARASFEKGVLELTLPKLEKTPQRTVKVE